MTFLDGYLFGIGFFAALLSYFVVTSIALLLGLELIVLWKWFTNKF